MTTKPPTARIRSRIGRRSRGAFSGTLCYRWQAHAERTGEHIPIRLFYNSHISGNDFTALVRVNMWADSQGLQSPRAAVTALRVAFA